MSLATIYSRALVGVEAPLVTVEVHISGGLPALSIVGLPEMAVRESKDRVRAALINANFEFPARRITVNLAPADLPKEGGRYDLAIALGILAASKQLSVKHLHDYELVGELSLGGELRAIRGSLPTALHCASANRALILPAANAAEAALAESCPVLAANSLLEVCSHLNSQAQLQFTETNRAEQQNEYELDWSEVKGQSQAKRALEIAAAGEHNLLMIGPPGTGKTMLASRLPTILPPLTQAEAIESAALLSISNEPFDVARWGQRCFRAPHHTASAAALVGGGSIPRPGEISLAHHGVLFLDELTEYERRVLDVLREPMEKGRISISRAARQAEFPARFQLIAAMNPCPCGYFGDVSGLCRCTAEQISRYRSKISGPVLDRIDMHIHVTRLPPALLNQTHVQNTETSRNVRERVLECRERQLQRNQCANAQLSHRQIKQYCALEDDSQQLLNVALEKLCLSARGYDRILKVARTIADLESSAQIQRQHISEAIGYRALDRFVN